MHNIESVQENETRKLLWDFEIQTDYLISTRPSDSHKKREPAKLWTLPCRQTTE